jgi:hypothetical protein
VRTDTTLLDCPAFLDDDNFVRCGLPAEVEYRHTVTTTDGPLEMVKISCLRRHWFIGLVETLTVKPPLISPGHNGTATAAAPDNRVVGEYVGLDGVVAPQNSSYKG